MRTGDLAEQPSPKNAAREIVLCSWFVVTGAAFWGTYAGLPLAAPLTLFYGVFVVAVVVLLTLRLLRRDSGGGRADQDVPVEQPAQQAARKKTERRG